MPALVIAAMIPGVFKFLVDALRWHAGDHVGPLGDGVFNVWAAGKLVLSGHVDAVFDHYLPVPTVDGVALRSSPYPPSMLLIAVPFGLFSPAVGVVLYNALSVLILAVCLRGQRFGYAFAAAILVCPAALESLADSQNGALVAGLLVAGLWQAERKPWAGGVLLGLVTVKPQLGLLIPFYLLARGNWRAIAGAVFMAICLGAFSAMAFGLRSWWQFLEITLPFMSSGLVYMTTNPFPGPQAMMMSVFSLVREGGGSVGLAYAVQAMSTLAVCCGAFGAGRFVADRELRLAILLVMISLASPYLWCYDMIPGSVGVALLIRAGMRRGFYRGEFFLLALLWVTPGMACYLAALRLPSFCPPVVAAVLVYAWRHARAEAAAMLPRAG